LTFTDSDNNRLYVVDKDLKETWQNVEATVYNMAVKWDAKNFPGDNYNISQLRLGIRSNHFVDSINSCPCSGRGYMGEFNYEDSKIYVKKEIAHPVYSSKKPSDWKRMTWWSNNVYPANQWIGMKVIVRNTSKGSVVIEVYRDLTDGLKGGNWEKIISFEDSGGWTTNKPDDLSKLKEWITSNKCKDCQHDKTPGRVDPIFTEAAHSCYIRSNNIIEAKIKKWSIREIDPLP
jgi:hypothetical protein